MDFPYRIIDDQLEEIIRGQAEKDFRSQIDYQHHMGDFLSHDEADKWEELLKKGEHVEANKIFTDWVENLIQEDMQMFVEQKLFDERN